MKCRYCNNEIGDGQTIIPVNEEETAFVCSLECKSLWEQVRDRILIRAPEGTHPGRIYPVTKEDD